MTGFESQLEYIKTLEIRNKLFESLSDEDKRKEIAYDSLMLIINGTITGSKGWYWSNNLTNIKEKDSKKFQQILQKPPTCSVCARGSMMLSQIRLGNNLSSEIGKINEGTFEIIKGFDISDFENMEREYENNIYSHPYEINTTEKLANICCNVIENGNFDKNDDTDYLEKYNIKI